MWLGISFIDGLAVSCNEGEGRDGFLQFLFMNFSCNNSQHVGIAEACTLSPPDLKRNTRIERNCEK